MRILVLLGLGADVRIAPERDPRSGRVREEWLVHEIDPAAERALDLALRLKTTHAGTQVTVMHLGPAAAEPWLRCALARGADRAVRVWDDEAIGVHVNAKAVILAAAVQAAGADLVLAGAAGAVDAAGQLGVLLAASLDLPCVTEVVDARLAARPATGAAPKPAGRAAAAGPAAGQIGAAAADLEMTRGLDRGFSERVLVALPAVATVRANGPAGASSAGPVVIARALLDAQTGEIAVWDLADLGVPMEAVRRAERLLQYGRPRPQRPRVRPIAAPDPTLPAFDRILKLIEGNVQRREGRVVRAAPDAVADEILQVLRDEGWLGHLRPSGGHSAGGADTGDLP